MRGIKFSLVDEKVWGIELALGKELQVVSRRWVSFLNVVTTLALDDEELPLTCRVVMGVA